MKLKLLIHCQDNCVFLWPFPHVWSEAENKPTIHSIFYGCCMYFLQTRQLLPLLPSLRCFLTHNPLSSASVPVITPIFSTSHGCGMCTELGTALCSLPCRLPHRGCAAGVAGMRRPSLPKACFQRLCNGPQVQCQAVACAFLFGDITLSAFNLFLSRMTCFPPFHHFSY